MKRFILILSLAILGVALYLVATNPTEPGAVSTAGTTPEVKPTTTEQTQSKEKSITVLPSVIRQGDPFEVIMNNVPVSEVKSLKWNSKEVKVFEEAGKTTALIGIDLREKTGTYSLALTLKNGDEIKKNVTVASRTVVKEELGIPEKLGGNTQESQDNLTSSLIEESKLIASIPTGATKLWSGKFIYPLNTTITITDPYGLSRQTVGTTLAHKGTDFRAAIGTSVFAMNAGSVAYTGYLRNYGNVIVLDHGLGLQTIYMHLSEVLAKKGDDIHRGQLLARSGDTGYVLGPHLHLSVKLDGISIDPMKFIDLLGQAR